MRGRKPKPSDLKLFEGNPGKRPLNAREPKPKKQRPRKPRHLSKKAKLRWDWLCWQLEEMHCLTVADGLAVELLADAYGQYREARQVIDKQGTVYTVQTNSGTVHRARPEVAIANAAWDRCAKMLGEFGLTPAARTRLQVEVGKRLNEDKADERLLGS